MADDRLPPRAGRMFAVAASVAVFTAITAVVTYLGYSVIFSEFQLYDDEGFFLVAIRSFAAGQPLYDKIVIQYGPFFFELFRLVAAVGVPMDLDSGRLITLGLWSAVTLLIGAGTYAFTRNLLLGGAAQLVSFAASLPFASDPMHPSAVLTLMVIGIEAIALMAAGRWTGRWPFVAIGALAGASVLTKINVGGFAVIAVAFACVVTIPALSRNPLVRLIAAAVIVFLPFALVSGYLDQEWARRFVGTLSLSALALVIATSASMAASERRPADVAWLFVGGIAITVVVLAIAIVSGSTPYGLLRGLILDPLLQSKAFLGPPLLPASALAWGLIGVAGAIVWTLYRVVWRSPEPALEGMARILVGLTIWTTLLGSIRIPEVVRLDALNQVLLLPLVLAWVVVAPRKTPEGWANLDFARVLLAAMAITQPLQAFPVAGAQVTYGSLPLVALGAVCIHDGLTQLNFAPVMRRVASAGLFLLLVTSWLPPAWRQFRDEYNANVPLALPGAMLVRLPADQTSTMREVTRFVHDSCDTYISIPGFESFYILARVEPPTPPTRWIWLITDVPHQQAVVDKVKRIDRLCVIENGVVTPSPHPRGPLDDYVSAEFVTAETAGSYTLLVRR